MSGGFFAVDHFVLADEERIYYSELRAIEAGVRSGAGDVGDDVAKHADEPFIFRARSFHCNLAAHWNFSVGIQRLKRLAGDCPCARGRAAGMSGQFHGFFVVVGDGSRRLTEDAEIRFAHHDWRHFGDVRLVPGEIFNRYRCGLSHDGVCGCGGALLVDLDVEKAFQRVRVFEDEFRPGIPVLVVIGRLFRSGCAGCHLLAHFLAFRGCDWSDDRQIEIHADFCAIVQAGEDPFQLRGLLPARRVQIDHFVLAHEQVVCLTELRADEARFRSGAGDIGDHLAKHANEPLVFRARGFHGDLAAHGNFAIGIQDLKSLAGNRPRAGHGAAGMPSQFDGIFIGIGNRHL